MWKAGTSIKGQDVFRRAPFRGIGCRNGTRGGSSFKCPRGFTFIELAVVLLILGIVLALAFPALHSLSSNDLKLTARHMIRTVYFLANRAAVTKRTYRLHYDLDRHEYWASVRSESGEFVPVSATTVTRKSLPESVRFEGVDTLRQGKITLGKAHTDFYPVGRIDKTVLHLIDKNERALTLVLNPLTGRVKVYEGYLEEFEDALL